MKILITGANGFIGKHLVEKLSRVHEIIGVDQNEVEINGQKIWPLDLTQKNALDNFLKDKQIDCLVHLAAKVPPSFTSPEAQKSYEVNLAMTKNTLEAFKKYAINQYIYASGTSVYGDNIAGEITEETPAQPANPYTKGKYEGEKLAESYGTGTQKVAILRIAAPYGSGQSENTLISKFLKKAMVSEDLTIFGSGKRGQDFIFIDDVCEAIKLVIESSITGVFNIASGQTYTVNDLAKLILKVMPESKSKITLTGDKDPQENYNPQIGTKKAEKVLNFKANTNLENGLTKILKNIK